MIKYLLSGDAQRKRHVETVLARIFRAWGYEEVMPPTVEYLDVIGDGISSVLKEQAYKFFDNRGNTMILRPDLTTPIAQFLASQVASGSLPIRTYYMGNVFRASGSQNGGLKEFQQAGVEVVGNAGVDADAEVVALAIGCLKELGVREFKLGLGQITFFESVLEGTSLDDQSRMKLKSALANRDFVAYESIIADSGLSLRDKDNLSSIPRLHGDKSVLEEGQERFPGPKTRDAIASLEDVCGCLEVYGLSNYIHFDLSILRELDYYTGMVFEAYAFGLGKPLLGGGRYDNLISKFGEKDMPATGFAIGVDQVLTVLMHQGWSWKPESLDYLVIAKKGARKEALSRLMELRRQGKLVELEIVDRDIDSSLEYAAEKNIKCLLIVGKESVDEIEVLGGGGC